MRTILASLLILFAAAPAFAAPPAQSSPPLPTAASPVTPVPPSPATAPANVPPAKSAVTPETDAKNAKAAAADAAPLPVIDTDETQLLPPYPPRARIIVGKPQTYALGEEDTLLDVARHFRLGFVEIRAANPDTDPWTPLPGSEVVIPSFRLLPRARQEGIVVNLAQMRMYYFEDPKKDPITFPIGIGREGLQTPMGETTVTRKVANPIWYPTDRMHEEKPWLPKAVPPGPANPLGTHALHLGWPTFLIHGSNKPWAIGRRVSSGCMRMYPEDIKVLFDKVPVGTKVTVVDQPILVGWVGDTLYLEANPSKSQSNDIEINGEHEIKPLTDAIKKVIIAAANVPEEKIDWELAEKAVAERRGYPVPIANMKMTPPPPKKPAAPAVYKYNN